MHREVQEFSSQLELIGLSKIIIAFFYCQIIVRVQFHILNHYYNKIND